MYNAVDIAKYVVQKYKEKFDKQLDELKLHKLLYLLYRISKIYICYNNSAKSTR